MMQDSVTIVDALILCGGAGTRAGGQDKGLLPASNGLTALAFISAFATQQGAARVFISANRHLDVYANFANPVLQDKRPLYQGPLAGIEAGLAACTADWLLVLPCDSLHLPENLLARFKEALLGTSALIAYAADAHGEQHCICLVHKSQLDAVSLLLNKHRRSLYHWQKTSGAIAVCFAQHTFDNRNSLADWQQKPEV